MTTFAHDLKNANLDYHALANRLEEATSFSTTRRAPTIAVIGDYSLDKYVYRAPELDELSVETGLVARQIRAVKCYAGIGGTIASNLRALGATTRCFGVIGEDGEGDDLLRALERIGADASGIVRDPAILTTTYMKPMAPDGNGGWREENRLDIRNPEPTPAALVDELKRRFLAQLDECDAVVVSDQFQRGSEALFSDDFRQFVSETAASRPKLLALCDSRFFADVYRNAIVKCNANELLDARDAELGVRQTQTALENDAETLLEELADAAARFARRNRRPVLVTRGANGSLLLEPGVNAETADRATIIPPNPVEPPIDICGAGDATNAGFAFAGALGFSLVEAAYLAGVVSSITIKQLGVTGVASVQGVLEILRAKERSVR